MCVMCCLCIFVSIVVACKTAPCPRLPAPLLLRVRMRLHAPVRAPLLPASALHVLTPVSPPAAHGVCRADFVWAIITIFDTADAYAVPCAEDSNIWVFSMAFVLIAPMIACCVSIMQAFTKNVDGSPNMVMGFIPSCVTLVLAVWGVLLWANMTGDCHHFYEATYPNLLLLFKISVIFGVISFVGFICVMCVLGTVLVAGLSQMNSGTGAGYNDIPNSSDDSSTPSKAEQTEDYV